MNLDLLRHEIDQIDEELMKLFKARMHVSKKIKDFKKRNQLPILDVDREKALIDLRKKAFNDEELWPYYEAWLKETMRLSKEYQHE
ncbi:MAG: chorismate mutase [Tenericutes bacterium HGW-Tenericutes-6]|jgi:monofunctional chorismate mutase|nr:MAG: chorismate mutase [Tenericutes bacterium HGW-Tenericutes-6]